MRIAGLYLNDIARVAQNIAREFGGLSYDKFVADMNKIESAITRLLIIKEGWQWLPNNLQQELTSIDWHAVTGEWNPKTGRHAGLDLKALWETIRQKLPEMSRKIEEVLKRENQKT